MLTKHVALNIDFNTATLIKPVWVNYAKYKANTFVCKMNRLWGI